MTDEHDNASGKRVGPLVIAGAVLFGLPALYLFSTGPATWLESRGYIGDGAMLALQVIYTPLRLLLQSSESIRNVFDVWQSLWR